MKRLDIDPYRIRDRLIGWKAPEIKQAFVDRHDRGEIDSEWSLRCFDGKPNGVIGWANPLGEKIVFLNAAKLDEMSTEEIDGTIAHERGHHENEYRPTRILWMCVMAIPGIIAIVNVYRGYLSQTVGWLGVFLIIFLAASWWSRRAEYRADRFAVERLGSTEPILAMLRGMQDGGDGTKRENGLRDAIGRWFDTHPLPSERIERIKRDRQDE